MGKIDKKFRRFWKNYLFQCLFATLTIFIAFFFLNIQKRPIIIASIGASTFIVFAMPESVTAKPRNVIGGHLIGLFSGSLCSLIPHPSFFYSILIYSLAVGLSMFIMVVVDTEHPPASGTALGVAIAGFTLNTAMVVIMSAIILSLFHHFFKPYLRDLT